MSDMAKGPPSADKAHAPAKAEPCGPITLDIGPGAIATGHYIVGIRLDDASYEPDAPLLLVDYGVGRPRLVRLTRQRIAGGIELRARLTVYMKAERLSLDLGDAPGDLKVDKVELRRISRPHHYGRLLARSVGLAVAEGRMSRTAGKFLSAWRTAGTRGLAAELRRQGQDQREGDDYALWISFHENREPVEALPAAVAAAAQRVRFVLGSTVGGQDARGFEATLASLRGQTHRLWEWRVWLRADVQPALGDRLRRAAGDDARVVLADGTSAGPDGDDWLGNLPCGDRLARGALADCAAAIAADPSLRLVYSDEDRSDGEGRRHSPVFKPDFSPDYLTSADYFGRLALVQARALADTGGPRLPFGPADSYDAGLRIWDAFGPGSIGHLDRILCHGAGEPDHSAEATAARRAALQAHLERRREQAEISVLPKGRGFRLKRRFQGDPPSVSLIVPTRDRVDLLAACIGSVRSCTDYANYEIVVVDNDSQDPATRAYLDSLGSDPRIRVISHPGEFNFSAINNRAVAASRADLIGMLNNDVVAISPDWLSEMASWAVLDGVGCVGAKLLYADGTIQHGGVLVGVGHVAGHAHRHFPRDHEGYQSRLMLVQNYSAVTGACLLVRRSIYEQVGGLNETDLKIAYNDVDFCLKVREAGYRNVWTPFAELYHYESKTRGLDNVAEKRQRYENEVAYMHRRWDLRDDPFYSRHLSRDREDFSLAV